MLNPLQNSQSILVADIKVVPERDLLTAKQNLDPEFVAQPIQQRIICLGFLRVTVSAECSKLTLKPERLCALTNDQHTEPALIAGFWRLLTRFTPIIIGWELQRWLLPILKTRALVYGVEIPAPLLGELAQHNAIVDLNRTYGSSAVPATDLEATARALGLPAPPKAAQQNLETLVSESSFETIAKQISQRVLLIYLLFLRHAACTGLLNVESHNQSIGQLLQHLDTHSTEQPFLITLKDQWQASDRPCPMYVPESAADTPVTLVKSTT